VKCVNCGVELTEADKICPSCGATSKVYDESVRDGFKPQVGIEWKHKRNGYTGFLAKGRSGHESSTNVAKHPDGVDRTQTIDREKDEYSETVIDKRTGKVVRDVHEPLSQHKSRQEPKKATKGTRSKSSEVR
jgi:hypothetical protein